MCLESLADGYPSTNRGHGVLYNKIGGILWTLLQTWPRNYSLKTVYTRENFWNVYCFLTNQKRDETTKDNRQTAACISHDSIRNDELAFSSNKLACLSWLTFKNQTTEFGIDLEAKFTAVPVFLVSYKNIRMKNHQSQPTSMTLNCTWGKPVSPASDWFVFFFSQTRCLALSDSIYSIQDRFPVNMLVNISFISILCTLTEIQKEQFQYLKTVKLKICCARKTQLVVLNQVVTNQCCSLAVISCCFISLQIGCKTINILEIFSGVHCFTGKTVIPYFRPLILEHIFNYFVTSCIEGMA